MRVGTGLYLVAVKEAEEAVRIYQGNADQLTRIGAEARRHPLQWSDFLMRLFSGGGVAFDPG